MRRLLRIDLSSGSAREEDIPSDVAESFVGGRGFGARYVYDEIPANTDPLGPQNKLLIGTGPLAGTSAQSLSKWAAYTRSPLTGTYTRSSFRGLAKVGWPGASDHRGQGGKACLSAHQGWQV